MTENVKTVPKTGLTLRLLTYSLPYWRGMLLSLILILVLSALINYLPILIKQITDGCLLNDELVAQDGYYSELNTMQQIQEQLEADS